MDSSQEPSPKLNNGMIEQAIGFDIGLKDYQLKAVTAGEDALGEATVWIEYNGSVFNGRGFST